MLFIVIHQVYELWFKQVLHEVDHVIALLDARDPYRAQHSLKRILTILKVLVAQLDILETMTPLEFQSFRATARGGERISIRSVPPARVRARQQVEGRDRSFPAGDARARWRSSSDSDRRRCGMRSSTTCRAKATRSRRRRCRATSPRASSRRRTLQSTLIDLYRRDPKHAEMCERLVDLDEGLQEWRYRHVKMVQRTIGAKIGTGGSSGAQYLATTLMTPIFPDLWEIRSRL